MEIYTVRRGDTLYSVGERFGVAAGELASLNQCADPSKLPIGQSLVIPGPAAQNRRSIVVNGFAIPPAGEGAISGAAPYLTYLSVFAARARTDGSLGELKDTSITRRAYISGAAPLVTLTNQRESGGFSSDIAHAVLTDARVREALVKNTRDYMEKENYYGLNVDFEYVPEEDRELYTVFLSELREALKPGGYMLSAALAPKTGLQQNGLICYEYDCGAIGKIVDYAMIMTCEWGCTYGPPQAVFPIDQAEKVLARAAEEMPAQKILMGMPNYGCNWMLPYGQGRAAKTVKLSEAPSFAYSQYAAVNYDEKVQAPYFNYYDSTGSEHMVWFDDPRSVQARLKLIGKYDLGGVSYWNINALYRPNWAVLSGMYRVRRAF